MQMARTVRSPSDRTLNRLIIGAIVVLVIGVPVIGAIYFMDRYVDPGAALPDRNVAKYEDVVRKNPNLVSARLALAGFYGEAKRWTDAVGQYGEVLRIDKVNTFALLGRANAYRQLNNLTAAARDYQAIIDGARGSAMANVNPQLESAYFQLGSLQLKMGKAQDAVRSLVGALNIDRGDADAMNLLGTAYLKVGRPDQAVYILHEAVRFIPSGWCDPYQQMVAAFTALKQADGVKYATAMTAFCNGDAATAKQALLTLLSGEFAKESLLGLGMIAESQTDWAAARDYYTKVLARDSTDFGASQGLLRANAAINGAALPSSGASTAPSSTGPNDLVTPAPSTSAPAAGGNG